MVNTLNGVVVNTNGKVKVIKGTATTTDTYVPFGEGWQGSYPISTYAQNANDVFVSTGTMNATQLGVSLGTTVGKKYIVVIVKEAI